VNWITLILQAAKWLSAILAALNLQRLNAGDGAATTTDLCVWVGIPAGLSAMAYQVEAAMSQRAAQQPPAPGVDWLVVDVSRIVQRLIAEGRTEEAKQIVALIPSKVPTP
jgi:hypothetical protein